MITEVRPPGATCLFLTSQIYPPLSARRTDLLLPSLVNLCVPPLRLAAPSRDSFLHPTPNRVTHNDDDLPHCLLRSASGVSPGYSIFWISRCADHLCGRWRRDGRYAAGIFFLFLIRVLISKFSGLAVATRRTPFSSRHLR
jgi:hypothetical protein